MMREAYENGSVGDWWWNNYKGSIFDGNIHSITKLEFQNFKDWVKMFFVSFSNNLYKKIYSSIKVAYTGII